MDMFAEIPAKLRKLCSALQTILAKSMELNSNGQFVFIMEEMIDERFSLFMNYTDGNLMLVDKINDNFDVKSIYDVSEYNDTIGTKLSLDYIVYSTFS